MYVHMHWCKACVVCVINSDLGVDVLSLLFFKPCTFTYYCFHKGFLLMTIILREGMTDYWLWFNVIHILHRGSSTLWLTPHLEHGSQSMPALDSRNLPLNSLEKRITSKIDDCKVGELSVTCKSNDLFWIFNACQHSWQRDSLFQLLPC